MEKHGTLKPKRATRKPIRVVLDVEVLEWLDENRGSKSRSQYMEELLVGHKELDEGFTEEPCVL